MAVQDRNMHRDAKALRKTVNSVLLVPSAGQDQDQPIYASQPRYNYRISDLSCYAGVVAVAAIIVKAQTVPPLAVCGEPQLTAAAAVTFAIEEFWQNDLNFLRNIAPTAAQAFTNAFTVTEDGWGVVLIQADAAQVITTIEQGAVMNFATEAIALENCPRPAAGNGTVAILTIEATGADFVGKTDDTDTANSFNTAPRDGHVVTLVTATIGQHPNAVLGTEFKDASGTNILQGRGGVNGDLLVVTSRMGGAAVLTNGSLAVDYRPWPAQGEGVGDASVSQTDPTFVP